MIELSMDDRSVSAVIPADNRATTVTSILEQSIVWFLGHGVWKWKVRRENIKGRDCMLKLTASTDPKPLTFGSIAQMGTLANEHFIPKSLPDNLKWTPDNLGQTQHQDIGGLYKIGGLTFGTSGETVLSQPQIRDDIPVCWYAFGLADLFVGFFAKGATEIRHQVTLSLAQTYINLGMSKIQLAKFMSDTEMNFDPTMLVREFPIPTNPENN